MTTRPDCLYCERTCNRCLYPIDGGWEHVEILQGEGSNTVVCRSVRVVRPLVDNTDAFFTHQQHAAIGGTS